MDDKSKKIIIEKSKKIHDQIEEAYLNFKANKGEAEWLEKQRLLLADMSLHLLQTSISPKEIDLERLKDNMNAILTITDEFLPNVGLKEVTHKLYKYT